MADPYLLAQVLTVDTPKLSLYIPRMIIAMAGTFDQIE